MVSDKGILLITGLFLFGVLFYSSYSDAITGYVVEGVGGVDPATVLENIAAAAGAAECVNTRDVRNLNENSISSGVGGIPGPGIPAPRSQTDLTDSIRTYNNIRDCIGIQARFSCRTDRTDRTTGTTTVSMRVGRNRPTVVARIPAVVNEGGTQRISVGCNRGGQDLREVPSRVLSVRAQRNRLYDPRTGILGARQIAIVSINELRNQNQLSFGSGASGAGSGSGSGAAAAGGSSGGSAGTGTGGSGLNDNIEPTPTTSGVCECNGFVEYGEYLSGKFNTVLDRKGPIELGNPGSSDHYPDTENQVDVGENLMRTLSSSITFVHEERSIIRFTEISSTFASSGGYDVNAKGACIKRFSATPHDSSCGNCQEKCNAYLTGLNRIKIEYDKSDPSGCGQHLKKSMKDHLAQTITGGFEGITDVTFSYTPAPKVESVGICKTSGNAVS